tara:strand:- start:619 stop:1161 length:543 start_codon:yes stop_codon:yes gene_type:complete
MAQAQTLYNEFGKTYYTLPLTITNVTGGVVIVKKVFVQNDLTNKEPVSNNVVILIDDLKTDFTNAQQLGQVSYDVSHSSVFLNNTAKNDKLNFEYKMNSNDFLTFFIVFNPHLSKYDTLQGTFTAQCIIDYNINNTPQQSFALNLSGNVDDKQIVLLNQVNYNNIITIAGKPISNVIKLF